MEFRHHPQFPEFLLYLIYEKKMEDWLDFKMTNEARAEIFQQWLENNF